MRSLCLIIIYICLFVAFSEPVFGSNVSYRKLKQLENALDCDDDSRLRQLNHDYWPKVHFSNLDCLNKYINDNRIVIQHGNFTQNEFPDEFSFNDYMLAVKAVRCFESLMGDYRATTLSQLVDDLDCYSAHQDSVVNFLSNVSFRHTPIVFYDYFDIHQVGDMLILSYSGVCDSLLKNYKIMITTQISKQAISCDILELLKGRKKVRIALQLIGNVEILDAASPYVFDLVIRPWAIFY